MRVRPRALLGGVSVMRSRTFAGFAGAVVLAAALAGCSDSADTTLNINTAATATPSTEASGAAPAAATFGSACSSLPTDPNNSGSVEAMAKVPVGTAASGNPQLSTLVSALNKAQLTDSLNSSEMITMFAPTNDAFAKISQAELDALMADEAKLKSVLTYHMVSERLTPDNLAGTHKTLEGTDLTVTGSGTDFMVNGEAKVVCGNIQTSNGVVYLIDSVVMPKS